MISFRLVLVAASSIASAAAVALLLAPGCSVPQVEAHTLEHLSPVYTVDREYRSIH